MTKWIDISIHGLPERSGDYIVHDGDSNYEIAYFSTKQKIFSFSNDRYDEIFMVTHYTEFQNIKGITQ